MSFLKKQVIIFIFSFTFVAFNQSVKAQKSEIYTEEYATFRLAQDLYDKEVYAAAQEKYNEVIQQIDNKQDEIRINSEYFAALCALELFHKDAEHLLNRFAFNHPDHPKGKKINFQLGKYYYRSKDFNKTIQYLEKTDGFDLSKEEQIELHFKLGYSYFHKKDYEKSKVQFHQVIQSENEYYVPAQYYYSHIAYTDKNYQTALEGFEKIADNEMFAAVIPYYITQIYYHQKRYDQLIAYAPKHYEAISDKRKGEFAKLIGDAYYYKKQYKEAIPYLLDFRKSSNATREDYYQLGYAYYQEGDFENATRFFQMAVSKKDALSQSAYYHMGDSYLQTEEKDKARNAFKAASELDFDADVKKNSLYNYAKLAYELSNNPYGEAIEAFQLYINTYPNDEKSDEAYEFLLKVYMTTKNYKSALESLEKIKNKDNRMKMAHQSISFNLAVELFHNKKYQEAIETFQKARTYTVNKELAAESYFWIAESHYQLREYDKAVSKFEFFKLEPGAALTPQFYNADYGIAYAYFMKASPFEVIENWEDNSVIQNQHNNLIQQSATAFRNFIVLKDRIEPSKLQDAYLRLGDCYYLLREDKNAIEYYDLSIANSSGDMSYAYYQKARSQGALGDNLGKSKTLKDLAEKYPNSNYNTNSLLELASTYMILNENNKAIETYKNFIQKYPNNANVAKANADIGFIYLRLKDYNNAEKFALYVLDNYPNDKVENEKSIQTIKGVYEGRNNLPGYYDWLASRGIQVSPSEKDAALWEPVKYAYDNGDCPTLINKSEIYIKEVPNGGNIIPARFYLAQCLFANDKSKALENYNFVIEKGNTQFYEEALQYGAFIAFESKNYPLAISHYSKLEIVASKEENIRVSKIAQMHAYKHTNNFQKTIEYADKVMKINNVEEALKVEAVLNKGLAQKSLLMYDEALITLESCFKMTNTIFGAEAKYNYAEILFLQAKHKSCEAQIMELVKQKPTYDYWIAKAIILLGRNYMVVEDYFNAKHSLQSVVDHYDGKDKAEMVTTAQQLIDEIIELENKAMNKSNIDIPEDIQFNNLDDKDKKLFE